MPDKYKIKICGLRETANIAALSKLELDYMGFIFYGKSARYFLKNDLENRIPAVPNNIKKIGVFVNKENENILEIVQKYGLDGVQLHGNETTETCKLFKDKGLVVFKAFAIAEGFDFTPLADYENNVDAFLFDTKTKDHGGSGEVFDWEILKTYKLNKPFMLAGGLSSKNLNGALELLKDLPVLGFDLNSQLEIEAGLKDVEKAEEAIKIIRNERF